MDIDPFLQGAFDFFLDSRHFSARTAIQNGRLRAKTSGHASSIDSGVTAADHNHMIANFDHLALVHFVQEVSPGPDIGRILALDLEL